MLERFLTSVQLFAASDYAKTVGFNGKPGSNIPKFMMFKQPDSDVEMWICKLEDMFLRHTSSFLVRCR